MFMTYTKPYVILPKMKTNLYKSVSSKTTCRRRIWVGGLIEKWGLNKYHHPKGGLLERVGY